MALVVYHLHGYWSVISRTGKFRLGITFIKDGFQEMEHAEFPIWKCVKWLLTRIALVLKHLHGQTSRVITCDESFFGLPDGRRYWVHGLVNFVPNHVYSFYKSVSFTEKQRKGKPVSNGWLSRNGARISDWNIPFEKTGLPIQMFRCFGEIFSEIFRWTTQNELCTIYFPTGFSRIFLEIVNNHYLKWISPIGTVELFF